jgi:hypothetical protein
MATPGGGWDLAMLLLHGHARRRRDLAMLLLLGLPGQYVVTVERHSEIKIEESIGSSQISGSYNSM